MQLTKELKNAIEDNAFAAIATHLENDEIQNHLMWIDYKKDYLLINTEKERKKTFNIRNNKNITLVVFQQTAMYTSWEIRGTVVDIITDKSANDHIDKLSYRYTNKPYKREEGISWEECNLKDRELWIIEVNKLNSMIRPQAKSKSE